MPNEWGDIPVSAKTNQWGDTAVAVLDDPDSFEGQQRGGESLTPSEADEIDKVATLKGQILKNQELARSYTAKAGALNNFATAIDLPGAIHNVFRLIHKGSDRLLDAVGVPDYRTAEQKESGEMANALSPEQVGKVAEFLSPFAPGTMPQDEFSQGIQEGLKQMASGFTSPENVTLAVVAKKFPGQVGAGFAGTMIGDIPAATEQLIKAKTPNERGQATVRLVANVVLPKLIQKGLEEKPGGPTVLSFGKDEEPPIGETVREAGAPLTAKAVEETKADLQPGKVEATSPEVKAAVESPAPVTTATLDRLEAEGKAPVEVPAETPKFKVTQDGDPAGVFSNEAQANMVASGLSGKVEVKPVTEAGDLLQDKDAPFNLAGETAVDTERVAREKADAERKGAEAKSAQEKQQPGLPRTEAPKAEAGSRISPPEPGSMGASLGITPGPLPPVNLHVGPIAAAIKGFAGHTLPKFTAKLRAAGEAGARYLSSKIAAPYNSILFSTKVLETGVDAKKFGAALTEDNLRSIRADFYREATDARNKGDHDLADELNRKAANVRSLIGARSSFQTEAEYQAFLNEPATQEAVRVHKQLWESEIEPQFKKAQGLDPDLELPTRGLQTGARINLKALLEDEPGTRVLTAGRGSVLSTFRKKSPFAREAKGTGQRYETDYNEIIANTYARQLEVANQNDFHRILVENGLATVAAKRPDLVAGEAPSRPYPLQRRLILSDGKVFAKNENLYLPKSLEAEYRAASNLDAPTRVPFVKGFINLLNKGAIVSLSEATGHLWNLADAAFNLPKGRLLTDTLMKVAGRTDVVPTLFSVLRKSLADNKQQLAELANIGAMRENFHGMGPGNKVITWFDRTVRLILDDAYKGLSESGLVENTETARREFVNQVGQYNTRAQGPLIRLLRDTGLGPFATAGRNFNVLGIKRMLLSPGVEASGAAAALALRANVLGSIVGFFVLRGVLNQVLTGDPNGRKGTRLMDVDTGTNDKVGNSRVIPLGDLLGPGRGARVTGVRGVVESKRTGLNSAETIDAALRDVASSAISPAWGPPLRFASTVISGKQTPFAPQVAPQAKPGESQFGLNVGTALKEANPFLATGIDVATGKEVDTAKLAGRVSPQSRRTPEKEAAMPKIVDRAKTKDYKEWVIREARKLPKDERSKFVNEHSKDSGFTERDLGEIRSRIHY